MDRSRTSLLICGGVVFLASAVQIARYMTQPSDIWWTPKALGPSLSDVADRVEVYVRDVQLQEQVRSGRVQLLGDAGPTTVTESDIRFRFNNWDRIRVQEIPALLTAAVFLGASGVCLLLGIVGWMPARKASPSA
jgi:hypothetical protein